MYTYLNFPQTPDITWQGHGHQSWKVMLYGSKEPGPQVPMGRAWADGAEVGEIYIYMYLYAIYDIFIYIPRDFCC